MECGVEGGIRMVGEWLYRPLGGLRGRGTKIFVFLGHPWHGGGVKDPYYGPCKASRVDMIGPIFQTKGPWAQGAGKFKYSKNYPHPTKKTVMSECLNCNSVYEFAFKGFRSLNQLKILNQES